MRKGVLHALVAVVISLVLSACAPSLGNGKIRIEPIRVPGGHTHFSGLNVFVESVADSRKFRAVGEIDDRFLEAQSDVRGSVQYALERAFVEAGAHMTMVDSAMVRGDIREWYMQVLPEFPLTRANAIARIALQVIDMDGAIIFTGNYEGIRSLKHLMPEKRHTETTLQNAMAHAIHAALSDPGLIEAVHSAGSRGQSGDGADSIRARYEW
jgi:uncharacterized lipoprotein YajG